MDIYKNGDQEVKFQWIILLLLGFSIGNKTFSIHITPFIELKLGYMGTFFNYKLKD